MALSRQHAMGRLEIWIPTGGNVSVETNFFLKLKMPIIINNIRKSQGKRKKEREKERKKQKKDKNSSSKEKRWNP